MKTHRLIALVAVLALSGAACGDGDDEVSTTTEAPTTTDATSTTTTEAPTTTEAAPTTTAAPATTTSFVVPGPTVPVDELPGDPIEIFPYIGAELSVFGVRHDDVLNVRATPGVDGEIVATLVPTDDGFIATGRHQQLPSTFWMEVVVDNAVIGWINRSFMAIEGVTTDNTAALLERIDDPTAPSLEALGALVAESMVHDPDVLQRIEMSVAPTVGDLGEVTYDVVGIGDDAAVGFRVHVFATDEAGDGTWAMRTVEVTTMCGRGGEPGGLCL